MSAKELATVTEITIPFTTILSDAIRNFFMIYKKTYFPVVRDGVIVGIIHIEDVKRIPLYKRNEFIVGYLMKKLSYFPIINFSDNGKEVLDQLIKMKNRPHLVVVKDENKNQVIGFIGEEDIVSSLQFLKNEI